MVTGLPPAGLPGRQLSAPAGPRRRAHGGRSPAHALPRLAEAEGGVLRRPDVAERFPLAGIPVVADGPEGLRARVAREVPLWREVIRRAKIAAE